MSIPIESLVSREPFQKRNSPSFQEKPLPNDGTTLEVLSQEGIYPPAVRGRDRFNPRLALILAGALGLSSLVMACTPEAQAEPPSKPQTQAIPVTIIIRTPTPEAPIPTPEPTATARPTAVPTETPTPKPEPTAAPKPPEPTPTPEVKAFDCGILSPEVCATAEYIQWNRPDGQPTLGLGFILKAGEKIKIPENLVVAGSEFPKPHTFNGYSINALRRDGKKYVLYIGDITPVNITNVGKDLPAGATVGIIAGSGGPVFGEAPHNLIIHFFPEDDLKRTFPDQTKNPPRIINNQPVSGVISGGPTTVFFDVKPPPDTVIIPRKK